VIKFLLDNWGMIESWAGTFVFFTLLGLMGLIIVAAIGMVNRRIDRWSRG